MDSEVYITKSNLERLTSKIQIKFREIDTSKIYHKDLSFILSQNEIIKIYKTMLSFTELDEVLEKYIIQARRIDTKMYVYEGGKPAYHKDPNCERLKSDFINLDIPEEIKGRGDAEIQRYRDFCKNNIDLLKEDETLFYKRLEAQFFLKQNPNKQIYKNSGITEILNLNLHELCLEIDRVIEDANKFKNKDDMTRKIIHDMGYGTHRVKQKQDPDNPLHTWHYKYKKDIKFLLKEYLRVKFNPELKFDGNLLDKLGFIACSHCHNE